LLLHIVDISHPDFEQQIAVVNQTLADIHAAEKPVMMIFNKIDAYTFTERDEGDLTEPESHHLTLDELQKTWIAKANTPAVFISARQKLHIEEFRKELYDAVYDIHVRRFPFNKMLY
jgi:GTP-binding protein HflX